MLKSPSLLAMGRFAQQKGFIELMDVIKKVVADVPNLNAYIVGKGPLKNQLDQIIINYDLQNNVTLVPFQSNPYALMKQVDVLYCHPFMKACPIFYWKHWPVVAKSLVPISACGTKEILLENHNQFDTQLFESSIAHVVPILDSSKALVKWQKR